MYYKTVLFNGIKIIVGCVPDTPEDELQKLASRRYHMAVACGLRGEFLKEYLNSHLSIDAMLEKQEKSS